MTLGRYKSHYLRAVDSQKRLFREESPYLRSKMLAVHLGRQTRDKRNDSTNETLPGDQCLSLILTVRVCVFAL